MVFYDTWLHGYGYCVAFRCPVDDSCTALDKKRRKQAYREGLLDLKLRVDCSSLHIATARGEVWEAGQVLIFLPLHPCSNRWVVLSANDLTGKACIPHEMINKYRQ